jgi:predicted AAA+ superfamily ATPase
MLKREIYLKKIRQSYESELIKVIIGIRRCGKSVLLNQIMDELRQQSIKDSQIIYINFEDFDFAEYTDPKKFHEYIKSLVKTDQKYYMFFDEIQYVSGFEKVINSFRVKFNCSIFITGSNSKLLSGDFATVLAGRYIQYRIMPLVFSEFMELIGAEQDKRDILFNDFLEDGGMPYIYNSVGNTERKLYIRDLYNSIILKDIVERYNIKDTNLLDRVVQFLMENIGGLFSANSIAKYLRSEKINTTVDTVLSYADKIYSSMIFDKVSRYDIRGKKVMSTLDKYYIADLGFLKLKKSSIEQKIGGRLENVVYNELLSRGYKVYIGKTVRGEVDFVADYFGEIEYYQVADYLSDEDVIKREFGAFAAIKDNYKKVVLTQDRVDYSRDGIKHINITDWLLDK